MEQDKIVLKNGLVVRLKWNWLVIERLESSVGDLNALTEKGMRKRGYIKTVNDMVYAVVQENIDEEMTRNELIRLIDTDDMEKIVTFIQKHQKKEEGLTKDIKK